MYLITNPSSWILPLSLFFYIGPTITFVDPLIDSNARWVFTMLLCILLYYRFQFKSVFNTQFAQVLMINILWAAMTIIWSDVPLLSSFKVIALCLVSVTLFYGSYIWVCSNTLQRAVDFLWLLVLFAFMAAIFGLGSPRGTVQSGVSQLYQGLVSGPNMLGSLLMMCTPLLVWKCYSTWPNLQLRIFWLTCLVIEFVFLFMANSRASLLAALLCVVSIVYSLGHRRWIPILVSFILLVSMAVTISPLIYERMVDRYIFKNASEEQGVLYTRETVWGESYRLAKLGGWFGAGYGVTIGDTGFETGLTSVGYGREKGNSQLAIMEESGIVGLIFYVLLLLSFYVYTMRMFFSAQNIHLRVLLGISIGMISGLVFQSFFEAWWVAPGSPEYAYFWIIAGYSVGTCQLIRRDLLSKQKERKSMLKKSVPRSPRRLK